MDTDGGRRDALVPLVRAMFRLQSALKNGDFMVSGFRREFSINSAKTLISTALALCLSVSVEAKQSERDGRTTTASSNSDIVVIGPKKRRERAEQFIKASIEPAANDQFARYVRPVCPKVLGLSESTNSVIEKRMRKVAEAAEIKVKSGRCKPNMTVLLCMIPKRL